MSKLTGLDASQHNDLCLDPEPRYGRFGIEYYVRSDHGYSYSMGIGDAWSVQILLKQSYSEMYDFKAFGSQLDKPSRGYFWRGGNPYHYGIGKPRYPVPAIYDHGQVSWFVQSPANKRWFELCYDREANIFLQFKC